MRFAILLCALLAAPALAQSKYLRPLDASDPDMRSLMERFFELTPCSETDMGLCPEALGMLRGGGNRLARYLIRQHEENKREDLPNQVTYLRLLGHTESSVATDYLITLTTLESERLRNDPSLDPVDFQTTLEALGRTRAKAALPAVLAAFGNDHPEIQMRAINAAERIEAKNGPQPGVREELLELRARLPDTPDPNQPLQAALVAKLDRMLEVR